MLNNSLSLRGICSAPPYSQHLMGSLRQQQQFDCKITECLYFVLFLQFYKVCFQRDGYEIFCCQISVNWKHPLVKQNNEKSALREYLFHWHA